MEKIKLGDKVRDRISGFEGIATSRTEYLNGCFQIEITPKLKKSEKITSDSLAGVAFDQQQIEKVGNGLNTPKKKVEKADNGGPIKIRTYKK